MKVDDRNVEGFGDFVRAIVGGDEARVFQALENAPHLARANASHGASRQISSEYFFEEIAHFMYAGDTALHMAAAARQTRIADRLIAAGADVRAKNRRGAEPLHYAVDGGPGAPGWDPRLQVELIAVLLRAGADPNAVDKSGVAPLHRAVRNRCAAAVRALIDAGADPRMTNGSGSLPLDLARQNTGRSGSGSTEAKAQQAEILRLLRERATA